MSRYLLVIKDKNEVYRDETNGIYLHEDAAYYYLASKYNVSEEEPDNLASIELGIKGYIVVFISPAYIFMVLPSKLNEDQKLYLESKRDYLRKNLDNLSIVDLVYEDDILMQKEYIGQKLHDEFDLLIDRKIGDIPKVLVKK